MKVERNAKKPEKVTGILGGVSHPNRYNKCLEQKSERCFHGFKFFVALEGGKLMASLKLQPYVNELQPKIIWYHQSHVMVLCVPFYSIDTDMNDNFTFFHWELLFLAFIRLAIHHLKTWSKRWDVFSSFLSLRFLPSHVALLTGPAFWGISKKWDDETSGLEEVYLAQGTNISHLKVAGKMIFLFHRWDMLYSSQERMKAMGDLKDLYLMASQNLDTPIVGPYCCWFRSNIGSSHRIGSFISPVYDGFCFYPTCCRISEASRVPIRNISPQYSRFGVC